VVNVKSRDKAPVHIVQEAWRAPDQCGRLWGREIFFFLLDFELQIVHPAVTSCTNYTIHAVSIQQKQNQLINCKVSCVFMYIRIYRWKNEHAEHVWWLTSSVRRWQQIYPPLVNTCIITKPQTDSCYVTLYINVYVSVYKHTQITGHPHGSTVWQSFKYVTVYTKACQI
jgi:hypothetical protein